MKKLLIFMLVLGLASTASAVLQSSVQTFYYQMDISASGTDFVIGDVVTIEIFAGSQPVSAMLTTVLNISEATSMGSITQGTPANWSSYTASTSTDGGGFNVNVDGTLSADIPADALVYSVTFVANGAGTITIDAVSGNWSNVSRPAVVGPLDGFNDGTEGYEIYGLPYDQVTIVPEPMTVLLLGLGGLFLRRRR